MIYGERVRLRAIERGDIPTFVRWFNDPEVRQYLLMYEPMSEAKEEQWFEEHLQSKDFIFGIEVRTDDGWVLIGNLALNNIDWKNRSATFGIVLGEKDYWGQGYGTDAARTMLKFAFEELNLHRVMLDVYDFNPRAMRCYEKVGFRHEGTKREALFRDGRYHDVHIMAILQHEFLAKQGPTRQQRAR
jgi:RimJ/RimL family protein N-acetyltransferase